MESLKVTPLRKWFYRVVQKKMQRTLKIENFNLKITYQKH
jgi:hypothetical protein